MVPSENDKMIELKWKFAIATNSTTVLCFSNYNGRRTMIATVDLKTRRKIIIKQFPNQRSPTTLFQVSLDHFIFGTEEGFLELWNKDETLKETIWSGMNGAIS
mmetsp:Transcript_9186/g.6945  ORF Transcript_9186/g.6945 Transcript_9186/m.6945 type:complete len:103 (+) Transcript_9186:592-900(+)